MDNKRKASRASNGTAAEGERAAKRRKSVLPPTNFDLSKGETPESTTAYGLAFLESIRRTADKSGRLVAGYFEELPPRKGNEDYYAKTPMPISLTTLEQKLYRRDFANLVEFEAWLRRMVKNAKDYYPRTSQMFEDAERVRKAVSNYMTKTNPAYRSVANYSSQPIPVPDDYVPTEWEDGSDPSGANTNKATANKSPSEANAEGEGDEDAEGEEEEEEGEDEEEEDEEDEEDEEEESDAGAGRRKIVIKTRTPGRPVSRGPKARPDHEYEGIPYKGLSFQQTQEKIVEEMIRAPDDEDPAFAKFEVFLNLPPRSLKDYFSVIRDPLSLKALQKQVKGIHGRQPATGVSDFKSWAAFEERASLLWDNAHFYNEENSPIYNLATELKRFFEAELEKAKAVVKEPPQPQKIKLRVPSQPQSTPPATGGPKKITIVHGGGSATATPTPQTADTDNAVKGQSVQRTPMQASNGVAAIGQFVPPSQPPNRSSISAPMPSPSPALPVKEELPNGQTATYTARPNGYPPQTTPGTNGMPPPTMVQAQYPQQATPVPNMYQPHLPHRSRNRSSTTTSAGLQEEVRPMPLYRVCIFVATPTSPWRVARASGSRSPRMTDWPCTPLPSTCPAISINCRLFPFLHP